MTYSAVNFAPPLGLEWAHPLVQEWFVRKFGTPTEPQEQGWPHILAGRDTLICAPTGSGKTLAAFLACIDRLVRQAIAGTLTDATEVLYVSPLKALGNDIQKNLDAPLAEIIALAGERGYLMPEIRTAVRTGDTHMHERQAMLRRPPHILVTTPESLYILLTARKSREILRTVKTVIVDEIHAMADDKRGSHLALSLERLDALTGARSTRIGLSATQKPIELVAQFLSGAGRALPDIVQIAQRRQFDLAVEVPGSELGPVASNEMWDEIYQRIADLVRQHRSTLVFVNTRRLAERVGHHLTAILGEDAVASHHGSLSRQRRLAVETRLKAGELRVLVATASLELGIDIGNVDLVCQIGSPRSVAVALQRAGRAGHWRGAIPKARIFATTRDELLECAALVRAIRAGELDRILIPESPLDVLAQQIVAACAADDWTEDDLFAMVRRAYPYRNLKRAEFDEIVAMLSEGIAARRGRYSAYLHRDGVNLRLKGRRGARLAAITSGGAIPDNALYTVRAEPEGFVVGTVDEDFAVESMRGDILLLGNNSWRIRRVQQSSMIVEDAKGAPPTVPFWRGEAPSRTAELSAQVAEVRAKIDALTEGVQPVLRPHMEVPAEQASLKTRKLDESLEPAPKGRFNVARRGGRGSDRSAGSAADITSSPGGTMEGSQVRAEIPPSHRAAIDWLKQECSVDQPGAEQIVEYVVAGRAVLRTVPTQKTIVAERFFDESGGMQLVIHAPFGGRVNKAWGLALRKRFCRSFNFELQAAATDNGLNISLSELHSFPLGDVFRFLQPEGLEEILEQAVLTSPIFTTRWRWVAGRSLALLRFMGGKKVPPPIQRMRSDDLLAAVFPEALACQENITGEIKIPDHPLVRETMKDSLTEAMDVEGLKEILAAIRNGEIRTVAVDTPVPSQFSHEILNANPYAYLDDAPLEERRARAVEMRRSLPEAVLSEIGRLDPRAIAQVREEAWPDVRDADELHDSLQTFVAFPLMAAPEDSRQGAASAVPSNAELFGALAPEARESISPLAELLRKSAADWAGYFAELVSARRVLRAVVGGHAYWLAAEKSALFARLFPDARFETASAAIESRLSREEAVAQCVTGWMSHAGIVSVAGLSEILGLPASEIDKAMLRLEASGSALRGNFTGAAETEWCDRRLLARIHKMTLGELRSQIQPATASQFMRWLLRWQHVAPGTRVLGEHGTLEVLKQLQGFEAPANAWERQILSRRIANYDPEALDRLCLTGAVGWGRLSPHPATVAEPKLAEPKSAEPKLREPKSPEPTLAEPKLVNRRVIPSSVAPVAFFVREDSEWMIQHRAGDDAAGEAPRGLSAAARETLSYLQQRGASFFADLVRGTRRLKSEVESALWELVTAGIITADGFDNIRALIDPKRRSGHGKGANARPRHSSGRWSLLYSHEAPDRAQVAEATCWMLLNRYGVVFREMTARETIVPRWRELLISFRRMEDRGVIRGGHFVNGFLGEQFALPLAVESLRAARREAPSAETVTISAADPLNFVGIIVPGERVAANSGKTVTLVDGVAASAEEAYRGLSEAVAI
jgi:ATP-dependent helicase Lhr and Lhr-like helicase